MIFLGDVSLPQGLSLPMPAGLPGGPKVANLEGAIVRGTLELLARRLVYNDVSVISYLQALDVRAVTLANNHIGDLGADPAATREALSRAGIASTGAGRDAAEAARPATVEGDKRWVLLGFSWGPIGGVRASARAPGVNPLTLERVVEGVRAARAAHPDASIAVLAHWNYELELLPHPMHREIAFAAIEAGADAVVGSHPHRVGGVEIHRGRPIAYSLGNWMVPHGSFFGGRLAYPPVASTQLALESTADGDVRCHWFEYEPDGHALRHLASEPAAGSARVAQLTPFAGMDPKAYRAYFRKHRLRRSALPVYARASSPLHPVRDAYVTARQVAVDGLFAMGLKGFIRAGGRR